MNIEKQIEFDKIKEKWMELAITDQAKEQVRTVSFCLSEMELRKRLKDTTDSRLLMEQIGMPPLQNVSESKEILVIAEKGGCAIVPMALNHTEDIFEAHIPWIHKTHIILEYCKPIYPKDLPKEDRKNLSNMVEKVIKDTYYKNQELV